MQYPHTWIYRIVIGKGAITVLALPQRFAHFMVLWVDGRVCHAAYLYGLRFVRMANKHITVDVFLDDDALASH
jgi:hypothetical protein